MRILRQVIWAKGKFPSPQHSQVQDRFGESVVPCRPLRFSRPRVNQEALASAAFAIHEAEALFPGGLPFGIPSSDPAAPAKPLARYFEPGQ